MKTRFGTPLDYGDYKDFEIDPAIDGQKFKNKTDWSLCYDTEGNSRCLAAFT